MLVFSLGVGGWRRSIYAARFCRSLTIRASFIFLHFSVTEPLPTFASTNPFPCSSFLFIGTQVLIICNFCKPIDKCAKIYYQPRYYQQSIIVSIISLWRFPVITSINSIVLDLQLYKKIVSSTVAFLWILRNF